MKEKETDSAIVPDWFFEPVDYTFSPFEIPVKNVNILERLGMNESDADEYLIDLIENLTRQCRKLAAPAGSYAVIGNPEFIKDTSGMLLSGASFNLGKMVSSFLRKSEMLALFAGSCGFAVENFSKKLVKENHMLEGYLVDLIASEIAEGIAEALHLEIEKNAARVGLSITNRYSPGYCNWPVSDQPQLFSLLGDHNCGISLTESSLMLPVKSVSGLVGVGRKVKKMGYKCKYCDDEMCVMRGR